MRTTFSIAVLGLGAGLLVKAGAANLPPVITQQPTNLFVPLGSNATFTVTAQGTTPLNYQWFYATGTTGLGTPIGTNGPVLGLRNVQPLQAGNYRVLVQNQYGSVTSALARLVVGLPPAIVVPPVSITALAGTDVELSVVATGTTPLRYQWTFFGTNLPGMTNPVLLLRTVGPKEAGPYAVIVSNAFGIAVSDPVSVSVLLPPVILIQPQDQRVPLESTATFNVVATGSTPLFFQWLFNGKPIAGANDSTFTVTRVTANNLGTYSVVVSNAAETVQSSNAALQAAEAPLITVQPVSLNLPVGGMALFVAQADGTGPFFYQWQFNGVDLAGATNRLLVLKNVNTAHAGAYQACVFNSAGTVCSSVAMLEVFVEELLFSDRFPGGSGPTQSIYFKGHGVNYGAMAEPGEPLHAGKRGTNSVWLTWKAPATGVAKITTANSDFDTLLAVYTGDVVSNLVEVASDDDDDSSDSAANAPGANPYGWSVVRFNAVAGREYHIAVAGFDSARGNIVLECGLEPTTAPLPCILLQPRDGVLRPGEPHCFEIVFCDPQPGAELVWLLNGKPISNVLLSVDRTNRFCRPPTLDTDVGIYQAAIVNQGVTNRSSRVELQFNSHGDTNALARDKFLDTMDHVARSSVAALGQTSGVATAKSRGKSGGGSGRRGFTTTQIFSTWGAGTEPGEMAHCGNGGPHHSKWYAYQAPTNGTMRVTTAGSDFDTVLAVYIGPGTDFATLTNIACNNDARPGVTWSDVSFPATAGTIYFIAVDGADISAMGLVHLNIAVGDPVIVVSPPAHQTVLPGATVNFSVDVSGMSNFVYRWRFNGGVVGGAVTSAAPSHSLTLPGVLVSQAGIYDVVILNPINAVTSPVAVLTVLVAPSFTQQPVHMAVRQGSNATLPTAVSGAPAPWSQWFFNNAFLSGQTNLTLSLTNFQLPNQGRYQLLVTNLAGLAVSDEVELWLVNTQSLFVKFQDANPAFTFRVACPDSADYVLEASTTLTNWTAIATNPAPFGIADFVDPNTGSFTNRFYRTRSD
ncbi:MAG: immunoglobulin domain-containing protein [Verrucomicrobia bacterium]|nr:immunoglobulin domain-containing protein [Verrucomicrobiota bacterium]